MQYCNSACWCVVQQRSPGKAPVTEALRNMLLSLAVGGLALHSASWGSVILGCSCFALWMCGNQGTIMVNKELLSHQFYCFFPGASTLEQQWRHLRSVSVSLQSHYTSTIGAAKREEKMCKGLCVGIRWHDSVGCLASGYASHNSCEPASGAGQPKLMEGGWGSNSV